jgi:tripartite-type tricarboxylate transporter receptor subunit TctC
MRPLNAFLALLVTVAALWPAQEVGAQAYPARPIRLVVPYAAGGAADTAARLIGARLQETLSQPFIVDNRTGASGNIGADAVAKAAPDGYTLLLVDLGTFTIGPALIPTPFDPLTDFQPITMLLVSPYGVAVHPSVPANSIRELVAYVKANPGKLNYATLGTGSASHLAGVEFASRAGLQWTYVPYKGGAPALADVAGGQAQVLSIAMLSTYPFVRAGKLKLLAVMHRDRLSFIPDVPTMAELGYPGMSAGSWQALYAPKGPPREIVSRLHAAAVSVMSTPEMKKRFAEQGADVMTTTPEELGRFVAEEKAKWSKLIRENNIKAE